ncbi:hypothetical protein [Salipiger pallidus]|uniref:hypothetical protein n=1 Tax=Salipiger pallidus TaxID=1775170 RepID=UPI001663B5F3|nr:hypothetical protein [Salipiger pallidus]
MPDTHRPAPGSGIALATACGLCGLAIAALIGASGAGWGWALLAWTLGGPATLGGFLTTMAVQDAIHRRSRFPHQPRHAWRSVNV